MHTYSAVVERIASSNLLVLRVDLGFHIWHQVLAELAGVGVRDLEMVGGEEARRFLTDMIPVGSTVTVHSTRLDPITGRAAVILLAESGKNVGVEMVRAGYAAVWDGEGLPRLPAWPPVPAKVTMRRIGR